MQRRAAGTTAPAHRRITTGTAWTVSVVLSAGLLAPATAEAKPKPSHKELTARQKELADEAEKLSEQYNGLRERLRQAQKAASVARTSADRQKKALAEARDRLAKVAADAYKNGPVDPAISFASAGDPQAVLDRSAALNYFAGQDNTRVVQLLQTMQGAERARKAAEARAGQVRRLTGEAKKKRQELQAKLKKVERQLGTYSSAGSRPGSIPSIGSGGASAKAMGAVRAALSQLGVPYSWGGGTASGPSYGTAQGAGIKGFDCSGLTLYAYAQVGIGLGHYTGSQYSAGTHVSQSQLKPGDLVFFYSDLHHMGMYIGGGKMVHAPQTGDVVKIAPIAGRPFAGGVRVA
ncbi:NlpC/P60 family protein [Actinomadura montaniterrae]|uniref:NlpC/P60 family protein n=1 Tax=Actinomadura montaniterrae TaxID=1803903 RepID=A0A6L3VLU2_9ACTN|nr:NlpC/P60 family protein [Actinomadura montaniterrae]KAB2372726.1 NlpC/P60 family protein [Actinomadura montaniterrae]